MKQFLAVIVGTGFLWLAGVPAWAQSGYGSEMDGSLPEQSSLPYVSIGSAGVGSEWKHASNVVLKPVAFNSLPEFIRIQAETLARDCTSSVDNATLIKSYRYTSDVTRDNSLSASYLLDFDGIASKPQRACALGEACNKEGCYLVGYDAIAAGKWNQHFMVRQKRWERLYMEDPKTKAALLVFHLMTQCNADLSEEKKDACLVKRVWLERGFIEFKDDSMVDASGGEQGVPQATPDTGNVEPVQP